MGFLENSSDDPKSRTVDGAVLNPASAAWQEVEKGDMRGGRTMEELQQELEGRERTSVETQCEGLDEIPEDCQDRWFAGFGATTLDARELPESESGGDDAGSEEQELEVGVELASASAQGSGAGGSSSSSEDE